MTCADINVALSSLKNRPGEPHELKDERGAVVVTMYTERGFEPKTMFGGVIPCQEEEARDFLAFMVGAVELTPVDAAAYFVETS